MPIVITGVHGGVDDARYTRWLNDDRGPVRVDLHRRMTKVAVRVVRTCPRHTGRLVSTTRQESGRDGRRPYEQVTIGREGQTDYLGYILNGTRPHPIKAIPNRPNAHLRFIYHGFVVFAKETFHPGTRANNFLVDALDEARS